MKDAALIVAGIIFSIVALFHLVRLIYKWQITMGTFVVPISFSMIGLIIAIALALWMFAAAILD